MKRIKEIIPYVIGFALGPIILFVALSILELIGKVVFHTIQ